MTYRKWKLENGKNAFQNGKRKWENVHMSVMQYISPPVFKQLLSKMENENGKTCTCPKVVHFKQLLKIVKMKMVKIFFGKRAHVRYAKVVHLFSSNR